MTAPRFRQHTDGRWAFKAGPYPHWTVVAVDGGFERDLPDGGVALPGWSEAVLVPARCSCPHPEEHHQVIRECVIQVPDPGDPTEFFDVCDCETVLRRAGEVR